MYGIMLPPIYRLNMLKYLRLGGVVYLTNEVASDSDENHIENIPVVREYPEVFLEEPSGVPPTRQVEIRSDLTLVAYPIVKALY